MISDATPRARTLTPLRSVLVVSLPFAPPLQSMAASFHGSASARATCVFAQRGSLIQTSTSFLSDFMADQNMTSFDSSSTVLGYLRSGLVSKVSAEEEENQGHLHREPPSPPLTGACHRPPPSRCFPCVVSVPVRFTMLSDTFLKYIYTLESPKNNRYPISH